MTTPARILCLLFAVFSLLMVALRPVSGVEIAGGLLIVWLSALPAILYLQNIDQAPIPFLPAVGAYYLVFYGLPTFAAPLAYRQGDNIVLYERIVLGVPDMTMFLLIAAGITSMFAMFFLARTFLFAKLPRFRLPDEQPSAGIFSVCCWFLMIASLVYRLVPCVAALPSIGQFFIPAGYAALGGFLLLWHGGYLPRWQVALVVLILVPLDLYVRMRYLFITDVIFLGMFFGLLLWRCRRFKTIAAVTAAGVLIVATYSATTAYRSSGDTLFAKVQVSLAGAAQVLAGGVTSQGAVGANHRIEKETTANIGLISFDPRISPLINRIGHIWIFQTVFERTPERVPFWDGHTYAPLLTAVVPRIFYPAKPEERAGGEFGVRYGFAEADVNNTSFNIPWIVELFANFGTVGVVAGMAVFGFGLAALDRIFNASGASDLEFLIGLTVIFTLTYQESNLSVMIGSLPVLTLALYLYFAIAIKSLSMWAARSARRSTEG